MNLSGEGKRVAFCNCALHWYAVLSRLRAAKHGARTLTSTLYRLRYAAATYDSHFIAPAALKHQLSLPILRLQKGREEHWPPASVSRYAARFRAFFAPKAPLVQQPRFSTGSCSSVCLLTNLGDFCQEYYLCLPPLFIFVIFNCISHRL